MSKRAVIRIPLDMLHKLTGLPDDLEILHAIIGNHGMALDLVVTAPDMADTEVEIGCQPPTLWPLYQADADDTGTRIVAVDYPREPGTGTTEETIVVPSEYFDKLTATLDEPDEPNERTRDAAQRPLTVITRAPETADELEL